MCKTNEANELWGKQTLLSSSLYLSAKHLISLEITSLEPRVARCFFALNAQGRQNRLNNFVAHRKSHNEKSTSDSSWTHNLRESDAECHNEFCDVQQKHVACYYKLRREPAHATQPTFLRIDFHPKFRKREDVFCCTPTQCSKSVWYNEISNRWQYFIPVLMLTNLLHELLAWTLLHFTQISEAKLELLNVLLRANVIAWS